MPIETATYINQLNPQNPLHTDDVSTLDSHTRLIKQTLQATFPQVAGAISATDVQLSQVPTLITEMAAANTNIAANSAAIGTLNTEMSAANAAITTADGQITTANQAITSANQAITSANQAIASKAPLASPALSGAPTAPTASPSSTSTVIATLAAVAASIVAGTGLALSAGSWQLPGGTIIKVGTVATSGGGGSTTVTFPTAFPSGCGEVFVCEAAAGGWSGCTQPTVYGVDSRTASSFVVYAARFSSGAFTPTSGTTVAWIAVGS